MAGREIEICVVQRAYGGAEGIRVKAGTRFAVGAKVDGMQTITKPRYNELLTRHLVRPLAEADQAAAPAARPTRRRPVVNQNDQSGPAPVTSESLRDITRRRSQDPAPPAPKEIIRPLSGSPDGTAKPSLSSPEAQASSSSTSTRRGRRRSDPSPSTTPSASPHGPTSSMPVTGHGGEPSTAPKDSPG
jgi:hypothetical protein